jgi:DNA-binding NtrC family response regulator
MQTDHLKIVVFSKTNADRDLLRSCLETEKTATVFYFEKDTVCFENIETIQPNLVIAKTDSKTVAFRFLATLAVVRIRCAILVVSDILRDEFFFNNYADNTTICIKTSAVDRELVSLVKNLTAACGCSANYKIPYLGECEAIFKIRSILPTLNGVTDPVLITGEPGTGKELLARCLIENSMDSGISIKIDCQKIGSRELMGHLQKLNGRSTHFQDKNIYLLFQNIEQLSATDQSELLMLMDELKAPVLFKNFQYFRSFRLIATSQTNLERLVSQNKFRKEIYYRLNVIPIYLPPLRERPGDIGLLADFFTIQCALKMKKSISFFSDAKDRVWSAYTWPGNLDELKQWCCRLAVCEAAAIDLFDRYFCKAESQSQPATVLQDLDLHRLLDSLTRKSRLAVSRNNQPLKSICEDAVMETEKILVTKALEIAKWNRKKAASLLDISYKSLLNKIKIYKLI